MRELDASEDKIVEARLDLRVYKKKVAQYATSVDRLKGELSATRYYQRMFVWNTVLPDGDLGGAGT